MKCHCDEIERTAGDHCPACIEALEREVRHIQWATGLDAVR